MIVADSMKISLLSGWRTSWDVR